MTLPNPHDGPQASPRVPAWPMLTRPQEQLMQTVWRQQHRTGWCYTSQPTLAGWLGYSDKWIRTLVRQLVEARWLRERQRHGEVKLMRVVLPEHGPKTGPVFGRRQPRNFASGVPGNNASGDPGTFVPATKYKNTSNEVIGGSPPTTGPGSAPLFHPPAVNLWAEWSEHKRTRPRLSVAELLKDLFGQGKVCRVRFRDRSRLISGIEVDGLDGGAPRAIVTCPLSNGVNVDQFRWHDDALLKLEFYP